MKANYIGNKSDYNRLAMQVAREEVERQKADVCPACEKNIGDQVLAVTCKALQVRYGFGKQRLQQIVQDVENLFSDARKIVHETGIKPEQLRLSSQYWNHRYLFTDNGICKFEQQCLL